MNVVWHYHVIVDFNFGSVSVDGIYILSDNSPQTAIVHFSVSYRAEDILCVFCTNSYEKYANVVVVPESPKCVTVSHLF